MNIFPMAIFTIIPTIILGWFFRIKWKMLVMGIPAFISAYILEAMALNYFSLVLSIVIIAPIVEETLKFISTLKGNPDAGASVGMAFATIENFFYFLSFSYMFSTIYFVRAFSDPILHASGTSVSTSTWKKKMGLGIAILMHMSWNIFSLLFNPYFVVFPTIIYAVILYYVRFLQPVKEKQNFTSTI